MTSTQNYYNISTSFEKNFNAPIREGMVTIGRFILSEVDKSSEAAAALSAVQAPPPPLSLACASSGQKVILHKNTSGAEAAGSPTNANQGLQTLNFGKEATALTAAPFNLDSKVLSRKFQDGLIFGAANSVLAYDVDNNKQYFYKEVEDGVQALVCADIPLTEGGSEALVVVGGNCSVYGFDKTGSERYWSVTGDNVTAMMSLPWGKQAEQALVVASEDYEMRVFKGEEVMSTVTEVDRVRLLVPSSLRPAVNPNGSTRPRQNLEGKFAYLLDNGTVGVYKKTERVWRIKGKTTPTSVAFCDLDCDGVEEVIVGWDNGRVEVRSDLNPDHSNKGGEVLYRETFKAPVASILTEDYRSEGKEIPIVCTADGMVRGLTLLESRLEDAEETRMLQSIEALERERQMLASQLNDLSEQLELKKKGQNDALMPEAGVQVQVHVYSALNLKKLAIAFSLVNAQKDNVIHSCVLRSEANVFGDDSDSSMCFVNENLTPDIHCLLSYPNDVSALMDASIAFGTAHAESFQIYEISVQIPKFVMYALPSAVQGTFLPPPGQVTLKFKKLMRMQAVDSHLREIFFLPPDHPLISADSQMIKLELLHIRDGTSISVELRNSSAGKVEGVLIIRSEKMSLAGDLVTSLSTLEGGLAEDNAEPYEVTCDFPEEISQLQGLVQRVEESDRIRSKLSADMADSATIIKTLLLRAEDARLLDDLVTMRKFYATLFTVDQELMGENAKRVLNFDELKATLKELNMFIQWAGKLRLGAAKTNLIAACRAALKENRTTALIDLIRTGKE